MIAELIVTLTLVFLASIVFFLLTKRKKTFNKQPIKEGGNQDEKLTSSATTHKEFAIIGIGCRFPSGESKEDYWKLLCEGIDGVKDIPLDRWDKDRYFDRDIDRRNKMNVKKGGFLSGIDLFDEGFFGISGNEALRMDPQQRILLETTYEAICDAGMTLKKDVEGKNIGCFVGLSSHDYGEIVFEKSQSVHITGKTIVGISSSIASNRISYVFGLRGPSFTCDTACSSSLVAINQAVLSMKDNQCDMAIVAGCNVILRPQSHLSFSKGGFLSKDGVCRSFDEDGNGYVRSEGCGVFILKPLEKAIKDGNRIYASVVGTLLNQDGQTKQGISQPSKVAQEELIREIYKRNNIDPSSVSYIEAHGTGTKVGDPIEANAIGDALGKERKKSGKSPLIIGSVKANIGHCEPASGMAGMIKLALGLYNKKIFPNIHFKTPNSHIDWKDLHLMVPTKLSDWKLDSNSDSLLAGVSSFGFGGTNGHAIFRSVPKELKKEDLASPQKDDMKYHLLLLSAQTEESLQKYCSLHANNLEGKDNSYLNDLCYTTCFHRDQFKHRLSVVSNNATDLSKKLKKFSEKKEGSPLLDARRVDSGFMTALDRKETQIAFVYSGQGSQYSAMGKSLISSCPFFKQCIELVDEKIKKLNDNKFSIMEEIMGNSVPSKMNDTTIAQPSIFAIQYALTRLLVEEMGVIPSVVLGHSIGEVAAAWASGKLSFDDAVRVIYHRSRAQHTRAGRGAMLVCGLTYDSPLLKEVIEKSKGTIEIAGHNGQTTTVIAGNKAEIEEARIFLDSKHRIFARLIDVDVAFHSFHMDDEVKKELFAGIKGVPKEKGEGCFKGENIEFFSTVTGKKFDRDLDQDYWFSNARKPVLFMETMEECVKQGIKCFVEVGGHPILTRYINEKLEGKGVVVPTLDKKQVSEKEITTSSFAAILHSVAILHNVGAIVDHSSRYKNGKGKMIDLPSYPFKKTSYWIEDEEAKHERTKLFVDHPLIKSHSPLHVGGDTRIHTWRFNLDSRLHPFIADHIVQGECIYPGAGHLENALICGITGFGEDFIAVEDVRFMKALYLPLKPSEVKTSDTNNKNELPEVEISVGSVDGDFQIVSYLPSNIKSTKDWTVHVDGKIKHGHKDMKETPDYNSFINNFISLRKQAKEKQGWISIDRTDMYEAKRSGGLILGVSFQNIREMYAKKNSDGSGETIALIMPDDKIIDELEGYVIHPAVLDCVFQSMFALNSKDDTSVYIPISLKRLTLIKRFAKPDISKKRRIWTYGKVPENGYVSSSHMSADIIVMEENLEDGTLSVCMKVESITCRYIEGTSKDEKPKNWNLVSKDSDRVAIDPLMFKYSWKPQDALNSFVFHSPRITSFFNHEEVDPEDKELENHMDKFTLDKLSFAIPLCEAYSESLSPDFAEVVRVYGLKLLSTFVNKETLTFSFLEAKNSLNVIDSFLKLLEHIIMFLVKKGDLTTPFKRTIHQGSVKGDLATFSEAIFKFKNTWKEISEISSKAEKMLEDFERKHTSLFEFEAVLIKRCMPMLAEIISGRCNAVELLFPESEKAVIEKYYASSSSFGVYNKIAEEALRCLLAKNFNCIKSLKEKKEQVLNIVEVGAGTGGLTNHVLKAISDALVYNEDTKLHVRYVFTDVSKGFLDAAKRRFSEFGFVEYDAIDVEDEKQLNEKIAPSTVDLIVASNVVHATGNLGNVLSNLSTKLTPGGMMCVLEVTNPLKGEERFPSYMDFTFGMTEGWWKYSDFDLRTHPSISPASWKTLLRSIGFSKVATFGLGNLPNGEMRGVQSVILAKLGEKKILKEEKEEDTWIIFEDYGKKITEGLIERGTFKKSQLIRVPSILNEISNSDTMTESRVGKLISDAFAEIKKSSRLAGIAYLWNSHSVIQEKDENSIIEGEIEKLKNSFMISNFAPTLIMKRLFNDNITTSLFFVTNGVFEISNEVKGISDEFNSMINTSNNANNSLTVNGNIYSMSSSSMWGFFRCLVHEHSDNLSCIVDISQPDQSSNSIRQEELERLSWIISSRDYKFDVELCIRGSMILSHEIIKACPTNNYSSYYLNTSLSEKNESSGIGLKLVQEIPGSLESLKLEEDLSFGKKNLSNGMIEVRVCCVGMNFKDVLVGLKMLDKDVTKDCFTGWTFGMECSGIISRVNANEGNNTFKVGDRVACIAKDSIASHVITDQRFAIKLPENMSFSVGSSVLFASLTAYYSLINIGKIEKGEKVLIHSATGGVGLSALRIAQMKGCEVFCTVGNDKKAEMLEFSENVPKDHIFSSKNSDFVKEVLKMTGGKGVDVILNSLSGELMRCNLECLDHYGRFIEIGKKDVYMDRFSSFSLKNFSKNLSYSCVDIDKLLTQKPETCSRIIQKINEDFINKYERNIMIPSDPIKNPCVLPLRVFPINRLREAFSFLSSGKHIGKVCLSFDQFPYTVIGIQTPLEIEIKEGNNKISPNKKYIISGGTSGFGFECAKMLIQKGARNIVLFSRSGIKKDSKEEKELVELREKIKDLNVSVFSNKDCEKVEDVRSILEDKKEMEIGGVIHSVLVLEDKLILKMDYQSMMKVVRPKSVGGYVLHRLLEMNKKNLDFFLCFTSIANTYGTPGQSNYASGNESLEGLMRLRNRLKLSGINRNISWGALGGAGFVARNWEMVNIANQQGWKAVELDQSLRVLNFIINNNSLNQFDNCLTVEVIWESLRASTKSLEHPKVFNSPRFKHFLFDNLSSKTSSSNRGNESNSPSGGTSQSQQIETEYKAIIDKDKKLEFLQRILALQVCSISGLEKKDVDINEKLAMYGFDSLMINQLRNFIHTTFATDISLMKLMKGVTICDLCNDILNNTK